MKKILVVDDSTFARSGLRRALQSSGYEVAEAASGEKALELAPQLQPDLITLDLLMPGLSGLETLIRLRPLCPQARYIVVTADIQTMTRDELLAAGANAFINKPVSSADLIRTVQDLLAVS